MRRRQPGPQTLDLNEKSAKMVARGLLVTWGYGIVVWLSFLHPSACLLKGNPICVRQFLPLLHTHTYTHSCPDRTPRTANPEGCEQTSQRPSMGQHTLVSEVKLLDQKDAGTLGKGEVWGLRPRMGTPDGKLFRKGAQSWARTCSHFLVRKRTTLTTWHWSRGCGSSKCHSKKMKDMFCFGI